MKTLTQITQVQQQVRQWHQQGLTVGFVPTMGNLHAGHLSLVTLAQRHCDKVVASVFVNPLQFGEGEDYAQYPRTLAQDEKKLAEVGCDLLFAPSVEEMYPEGALATRVCADPKLANQLEGAQRPGHFDGVTTVVAKLFHIVCPDIAVFGQKDYQQCLVIQKMVRDLSYPIQLIRAPISREADGLAMSSRNQYLTPEQRKIAPALNQVLKITAQALQALQTPTPEQIHQILKKGEQQLLSAGFEIVDYFTVLDRDSLQPTLNESEPSSWVLLVVARLGSVRLLDNMLLSA